MEKFSGTKMRHLAFYLKKITDLRDIPKKAKDPGELTSQQYNMLTSILRQKKFTSKKQIEELATEWADRYHAYSGDKYMYALFAKLKRLAPKEDQVRLQQKWGRVGDTAITEEYLKAVLETIKTLKSTNKLNAAYAKLIGGDKNDRDAKLKTLRVLLHPNTHNRKLPGTDRDKRQKGGLAPTHPVAAAAARRSCRSCAAAEALTTRSVVTTNATVSSIPRTRREVMLYGYRADTRSYTAHLPRSGDRQFLSRRGAGAR
eukprot:6191919-Pleurochrysis_carterae.AAC.1